MAAAPAPAAAAAAASSASTSEWRQAAWKFEGQDSSELSFDPGMIIRVDGKVHEEWWKGTTAEGEVGLFPANHSTPVRTAKEGELVLVLYDFMGKRDTDLGSLSKGETISVLVEQETGWWLGEKQSGETGMFPSNYVKKIDAKPPPPPPPPPPLPERRPTALSTAAPPPAASSSSLSSSSSSEAPAAPPSAAAAAAADASSSSSSSSSSPRPVSGPLEELAVINDLDAFDALLENGYVVEALTDGEAGAPTLSPGQFVTMHCRAMFWDAPSSVKRQFSSTRGGAAGAENLMKFTLKDGAVTRGLFDGLQTLRPGQRAAITCSPERAYGEAGMPPFVPPNAYVIYDIEVVSRHASAEDALASMGPGGIGDGGGSGAGGAGGGGTADGAGPEELFGRSSIDHRPDNALFQGRPASLVMVRPGEEGLGVSEAMLSQAAEQLNLAEND